MAKHGLSFQTMLIEAEAKNPKFGFLKPGDVYHPYYNKKIADFSSENDSSAPAETKPAAASNGVAASSAQVLFEQPAQIQPVEPKRPVRQPAPDQYSVVHPYISLEEREIIKLTAQFVARNGQKFLAGITERESKNPQFDFLKPTHLLFGYFTSLVDAYSKCLVPRKEELIKLQKYVDDSSTILEQAVDRYEYQKVKMQEEKKTKDEKSKEEEQEAMQIDWHDFVLVETITFDDEHTMADAKDGIHPGLSAEDLRRETGAEEMEVDLDNEENKVLAAIAQKMEAQKAAAEQKLKEANQAKLESMSEARITEQQLREAKNDEAELEPGIKIKTDYERKTEVAGGKQKCPKCGSMIPKEEFEKHLQIELVSPNYFAQHKDLIDKAEGRAMASGDEIVSNLQEFAKQRPDLYGDVQKQLPSSIREEEEKNPKPKFQYDGLLGNMSRTTANVAMMAAQQKKNVEEVIRRDKDSGSTAAELAAAPARKVFNLLSQQPIPSSQQVIPPKTKIPPPPPPAGPAPMSAAPIFNPLGYLRPGMPTSMNLSGGLLTIDKYNADDEASLMPEEQWLKYYPGNLTINIKAPNSGGDPEWNFMGQILKLSMDARTKIEQLKDAISTYLGSMPPKKMRLKTYNRSALKDEFSLAHYNIVTGSTLELSVKERGGRKK